MSRFVPTFALTVFSALALTSCATLLEGSSQEVNFESVGATDVQCVVSSEELKYKMRPPQTIWMKRSRLNLIADCWAAGNRHKTFEIKTGIEPWTITNVSNGVVPGVSYDAYSRAFFKYPNTVVIDMSDVVAMPSDLPGYHAPDGLNPKDAGIEYMGPKTPALAEDEINAAKRAAAFDEFDRKQAYEAERAERKSQYDPNDQK